MFELEITQMTDGTAIIRLVLAMIMGAALGIERTRKMRPAGLRTYMLVCIGSCTIMMTGIYVFELFGGGFDPARMASQVISGIGFIGAGTIMFTSKHRVRGLTTAAGIWAVACLGIAVGAGFYALSAGAFVLMLLTMTLADRAEQAFYRRLKRLDVRMILSSVEDLRSISNALRERNIQITDLELAEATGYNGVCVSCILRLSKWVSHDEILEAIQNMDGVILAEKLDA